MFEPIRKSTPGFGGSSFLAARRAANRVEVIWAASTEVRRLLDANPSMADCDRLARQALRRRKRPSGMNATHRVLLELGSKRHAAMMVHLLACLSLARRDAFRCSDTPASLDLAFWDALTLAVDFAHSEKRRIALAAVRGRLETIVFMP